MAAYEGGQHLLDGGPIRWGIAGDAFQRVDAAQADIKLVVAELVHGLGVAVGDLSLAGDAKLAPGEVGAGSQQRAGKGLEQRGTDVVLGLEFLGGRVEVAGRGKARGQHSDDQHQHGEQGRAAKHPAGEAGGQREQAPD